jgi:hypothetical protein
MQEEVGRELRADELKERTIVWLCREEHRYDMATMWVRNVNSAAITFLVAALKPPITLVLFRLPDGTLIDDSGKRMFVYEYLGEV